MDPNQRTQLTEMLPCQGFGLDVRQLLYSADCIDLHPTFFNTLSNEMIPNIDMFGAVVEDRVFAERDGGLVVYLQLDDAGFLTLELCDQPCQPNPLAGCSGCSYILCFTGGQCHNFLLL